MTASIAMPAACCRSVVLAVKRIAVGDSSETRRPMFRVTIGTWLSLALLLMIGPGGAEPPETDGLTEAEKHEVWRLDHGWPPKPASVAEKRRIRAHRAPIAEVLFTSDAKVLITAARDGSVRLWDAASGKPLRRLREHGSFSSHLEVSADDRTLVVGTADHRLEIWDLPAAKLRNVVAGIPDHFALTPDGKSIVGAFKNVVSLWDVGTGR